MEQPLDSGSTIVIDNDPLPPGKVAAFLDGRLEGEELALVEAWLADNPSARQEIITAGRILQSAPPQTRRPSRWLTPLVSLAAAAAIAVMVIQPRFADQNKTMVVTERRGTADESDRISLVSPADGERIGAEETSFAWRPIAGATYRLVITDAAGRTHFRQDASDTVVIVRETLREPGPYYWRVDALNADGSSVASLMRTFVVTGR